jgi:acyl-CoA thioesterase-1
VKSFGSLSRHVSPLVLGAVALAACRGSNDTSRGPASQPPPPIASDAPVVLFLGTSLTAGFGLAPDQAYPALIQKRLDAEGLRYRVVNAGVSGETSAGARRRIDWLLRQPVDVLVVETGANDGLRGQDPQATRANIQAILDRARREAHPPQVLLLGMQAPPNLGQEYTARFRDLFPELARTNSVALVPFLLEGVAGIPSLNQADGIHPSVEGERRLAETVWTGLRPLLAPLTTGASKALRPKGDTPVSQASSPPGAGRAA